jgi:hypothetical protein
MIAMNSNPNSVDSLMSCIMLADILMPSSSFSSLLLLPICCGSIRRNRFGRNLRIKPICSNLGLQLCPYVYGFKIPKKPRLLFTIVRGCFWEEICPQSEDENLSEKFSAEKKFRRIDARQCPRRTGSRPLSGPFRRCPGIR